MRLIDEKKYIKKSYLRKMAMCEPQYTMETEKDVETLMRLIEDAPLVDAVKVVRCGDCKYAMLLRKPEGKLIADCRIRKMNSEDEQFCMVSGDDFCSFGERREENEVD